MSTEKDFAVAHPGFWKITLPLSERFIRTMNRSLNRYASPIYSSVSAARRGLVNEAAFQIFAASVAAGKSAEELEMPCVIEAWAIAASNVGTMRQFSGVAVDESAAACELEEAIALAQRTKMFFDPRSYSHVVVEPAFRGCGWIDASTGDVRADNILFEIKAGDRKFRSIDLHQLLTYCALNFATEASEITGVGLVNPRVGTFAVFDLDDVCRECAGAPAADVLDEILQYISEPLGSYDH